METVYWAWLKCSGTFDTRVITWSLYEELFNAELETVETCTQNSLAMLPSRHVLCRPITNRSGRARGLTRLTCLVASQKREPKAPGLGSLEC